MNLIVVSVNIFESFSVGDVFTCLMLASLFIT